MFVSPFIVFFYTTTDTFTTYNISMSHLFSRAAFFPLRFYDLSKVTVSHNVKVSFHVGFRQHFIVLVFCLLSLFGSGMSLSFTYGSERPFGSIGTKFFASLTKRHKQHIHTAVSIRTTF